MVSYGFPMVSPKPIPFLLRYYCPLGADLLRKAGALPATTLGRILDDATGIAMGLERPGGMTRFRITGGKPGTLMKISSDSWHSLQVNFSGSQD